MFSTGFERIAVIEDLRKPGILFLPLGTHIVPGSGSVGEQAQQGLRRKMKGERYLFGVESVGD